MQNLGKIDRIWRLTLASVLLASAIALDGWWAFTALIPAATGFLGICPLYLPFGLNSKRFDAQSNS